MPTPSSKGSEPGSPTCANCGAKLEGRFCHSCGQEDRDLDVPFRELFVDWLGNAFAFDARVPRTLRPLFARPGFLTREYLEGRRARYVPPLRLYVFTSILFFLVLAVTDYNLVTDNSSRERGVIFVEETSEDTEKMTLPPTGSEDPATVTGEEEDEGEKEEGRALQWLGERLGRILEDQKRFNRLFMDRLAQSLIVLVPVYALFLHILFRRRYRRYLQHLVFSLHLHTAGFLAVSAGILSDTLLFDEPKNGPVGNLISLALIVYLFLALRRVYGDSRRRTAVKIAILLFAHLLAILVTMVGTLLLTLAFDAGGSG